MFPKFFPFGNNKMIAQCPYQVHSVRVIDASAERKTADILLQHMLEVVHTLQHDWKITVVAFTTDASGESKKARKLLKTRRPDLIVPNCFSHQVRHLVRLSWLCFFCQATDLSTFIEFVANLFSL